MIINLTTGVYQVYAILDPDTLDPVYIGQTSTSLKVRMTLHKSEAKSSKRPTKFQRWLVEQMEKGVKPPMRTLLTLDSRHEAIFGEQTVIRALHLRDWSLLNTNYANPFQYIRYINERAAEQVAIAKAA